MAAPSLTYTLTNGTTADASQVMQNFNDLLNGITDGTKDLSINALTCAGTATLNGHINLGNSSADDLTITASLASTLPIKTTNSYDIGSSTLGLRALYLGANSQTVAIKGSSSMSATWTLTLPTTAGTNGYLLETNGSGAAAWVNSTNAPIAIKGVTDGSSASSGYRGQYTEVVDTGSSWGAATSVTSKLAELVVPAGDWVLTATIHRESGTQTNASWWIATASSSTVGRVEGQNNHYATTVAPYVHTIPNYRVNVSTSTTYYVNGNIGFSAGTPTVRSRFSARRVY